jgi:glycosyltransferase involved in cell wall biosynthesis
MVVEGFYPSTGGAEMQAGLLSRSLLAAGHHVRILTPRLDRSRPVNETIDGVAVERIAYPRVRIVGAVLLALKFAWRLVATRNQYDAIHIHTAKNLATVAGLLRPLLRRPIIVKISGAWEFEGGILDPKLRRDPIVRMRNACIRRIDYVQCISAYTGKMLRQAGYPERRIRMIPNAVDLGRFRNPLRVGVRVEPVVLFVGRVQPVKGLDVLIDAWAKVRRLVPEARLIIAGDGAILPQLRERAAERGVADSVHFPGRVTQLEAAAMYEQADVYVQPSHLEGLPNSVLEAMASGLPIVATRVSGNEDLVVDHANGRLVPAGNPDALATALTELLRDPELIKRMGTESRRLVEEQHAVPAVLSLLTRAYRGEA